METIKNSRPRLRMSAGQSLCTWAMS